MTPHIRLLLLVAVIFLVTTHALSSQSSASLSRRSHHPTRSPELARESPFAQDVLQWLGTEGVSSQSAGNDLTIPGENPGLILALSLDDDKKASPQENRGGKGISVHLLPSPRSPSDVRSPASNRRLTDAYQAAFGSKRTIIHLHEDVWRTKEDIVKARILARLGRLRSRHFGRKTVARRIGRDLYMPFLEANHLWGATRAKFGFGLFDKTNDDLLAVATFSSRRHVVRNGRKHRSHELIRTCSRRDGHVVGGISKLIRAFVRDQSPDDIVTVVDRDWGPGSSSWHGLGFETLHIMQPLPMAIWKGDGIRRHLVGAGIVPTTPKEPLSNIDSGCLRHRPGLPVDVLDKLALCCSHDNNTESDLAAERVTEASAVVECILAQHDLFLVHDCGVERLILLVDESKRTESADWALNSIPTYATTYYSTNDGVSALLQHASGVDMLKTTT